MNVNRRSIIAAVASAAVLAMTVGVQLLSGGVARCQSRDRRDTGAQNLGDPDYGVCRGKAAVY